MTCKSRRSIACSCTHAWLIWAPLCVLLCLSLLGCGGSSQAQSSQPSTPSVEAKGTIPASFWGIVVNQASSFPLQVPHGEFRAWDAIGAQWPDIEVCRASSGDPSDSCYDWTNFDRYMSALHNEGVNDIMYTMSRTPVWGVDISQDPTKLEGKDCDYFLPGAPEATRGAGQCLPPLDLKRDGSGPNQIWRNWVTAIASRTNDPSYLADHAHIKYWEPWNEWYRSSIVLPGYVGTLSFQGTYAQMVRLTEDARCLITGKGTIHNYPAAGQSTPCKTPAIDPSAMIVSPSGSAEFQQALDVMQNFLYCSGTGSHAPAPGSVCSTGNSGSQAVDVINFHLPSTKVIPETVANSYIPSARAILQSVDRNKPFINGEGSWNVPGKTGDLWSDPWAQAGFIPRFFSLYWSAGLSLNMWYSYDTDDGQLYDVSTGKLNEPAVTAWQQSYKWLVGAKPKNNPFCAHSGTIYTCDFTEAAGNAAELVWDAKYGQNCSQMSNPVICGSTAYPVPANLSQDWLDVTGASHTAVSTVTIGSNPILLEGQ